MTPLMRLKPGRRFSIPDLKISGKLLSVTRAWATVRLDRPAKIVEIIGRDGTVRTFKANRDQVTDFSAGTLVEVERRGTGTASGTLKRVRTADHE